MGLFIYYGGVEDEDGEVGTIEGTIFSYSYSTFGYIRDVIAEKIGYDWRGFIRFRGALENEELLNDPLIDFLHHSDCDGEIAWELCGGISARLKEVYEDNPNMFGTNEDSYFYKQVMERMVEGFRGAYESQKDAIFR